MTSEYTLTGEGALVTDPTKEEWRPIVGHEGRYEVSNIGRVKALEKSQRGRVYPELIMKLQKGTRIPYLRVQLLGLDGRKRWSSVHVLVLEAFVCPRPKGLEARHRNGQPQDNRVENLAWGTHSQNQLDTVLYGNNPNANKTHCKRGHELLGENLYLGQSGKRACRRCRREATRRSDERRRHGKSA